MAKRKIAVLTSGWSVDYVLSVLNGMKKACENQNTDLYVFACYKFAEPSGENNTTGFVIFDLINFNDYDGIIIMPNLFNDQDQVNIQHQRILDSGVPAVSLNQPLEGLSFVNSINHESYKDIISHLIKVHKATSFGYLGGPEGNPGADSNFKAFNEAITFCGLKTEDQIYVSGCDWTFNSAYEKAKVFFADKNKIPQAIVCINDWAAMAVIKMAEENGLNVPDDLKVVGFDEINLSTKVIPSISTVNICADKMGEEAVKLVLSKPEKPVTINVNARSVFRQSCGCEKKITPEQIKYSQNFCKMIDGEQRFASHLRHLEDTFISTETVRSLSDSLQKYYELRHSIEGPDFAIFINENVISSLNQTQMSPKKISVFDKELQAMVNIQDGKPASRPLIQKYDLVPPNMLSDQSTLFLFFPIFNQMYLHGYYVSKNFTNLIENKSGYNWTRNFGTILEKFRQTSIYRMLSEKMELLSNQDALSGLYNRAGLDNYGISLFNKNISENKQTEIIFIDINNMKSINDQFGHLHGDLAVKTVAKAIEKSIPDDYIAVRYGGDEFVVIGTRKEETKDYCQCITEKLASQVKRMTLPYELTASLGSKIFEPDKKLNIQEAIEEVDKIMYEKKLAFHQSH